MRRPWRSVLFLGLAAAGLAAIDRFGPDGLYTFGGHGRLLNDAVHACLWLLFATHALLLAVMWTQRARWDDAEAGAFRWVGVKALFWAYVAVTARDSNGISLPSTFLLALIASTTIDLDAALVRRYVVFRRAQIDPGRTDGMAVR